MGKGGKRGYGCRRLDFAANAHAAATPKAPEVRHVYSPGNAKFLPSPSRGSLCRSDGAWRLWAVGTINMTRLWRLGNRHASNCHSRRREMGGHPLTCKGYRMRSQQSLMAWSRICGLFLIFLAVFDVGMSVSYFYQWRWWVSLAILPGDVFVFFIGWLAYSASRPGFRGTGDGGAGFAGAGVPVPVRPTPTHHLVAAKDLPPSRRTHLLPRD